jgi:hypothetical protein
MRVLVCGSRHFNDYDLLERTLDGETITTLIHGAARGADTLAGRYGERRGLDVISFPANWDLHGKAAGPIRNIQMLSEGKPERVIAFIAPNSRGTKHMVEISKKAGIPVKEIKI